jgi:hypothetical protein
MRSSRRKETVVFTRKVTAQKSLPYFELCDALRADGCPVCSLLVKHSMTALDTLLYEQVTDPAARDRLREAHGLCNWHAWMLLRIPAGRAGVALIYETLLGHQIEALQALQQSLRPQPWWRRLVGLLTPAAPLPFLSRWANKAPCPVCQQHKRADERNYLGTLLDALAEAAFVQQFRASFGLCLPHVTLALASARHHPSLPVLVQLQTEKLAALKGRLGDIIRTGDYRFAADIPGNAGPEWQRTIELFVGKPEVFGNERRLPGALTPTLSRGREREQEGPRPIT